MLFTFLDYEVPIIHCENSKILDLWLHPQAHATKSPSLNLQVVNVKVLKNKLEDAKEF